MTRFDQMLQLMARYQAWYAECPEDFENDLESDLGIDLDEINQQLTRCVEILEEDEDEEE